MVILLTREGRKLVGFITSVSWLKDCLIVVYFMIITHKYDYKARAKWMADF